MGFPQNLLSEDEEVILHKHPHWKELIGPVFWFVLFLLIGVLSTTAMPAAWGSWAPVVGWIVAILGILWLAVAPWVRWATTHYVFTTHRLLLRTGLLTRKGRDIPYARVNDVSFEQGVIQRMFGLGTLMVQSASEQGAVIFKDMPRVEMVQSTLYKLVEEDRNRRTGYDDGGGV